MLYLQSLGSWRSPIDKSFPHGLLVGIRQGWKETGHHQVQPTAEDRAGEHVQGDKPHGEISA